MLSFVYQTILLLLLSNINSSFHLPPHSHTHLRTAHNTALALSKSPSGIEIYENESTTLSPKSLDSIFDANHFTPNRSTRKLPYPSERERKAGSSYFTYDEKGKAVVMPSVKRDARVKPYRITKVSGNDVVINDEKALEIPKRSVGMPPPLPYNVPTLPASSPSPMPASDIGVDDVWTTLYAEAQVAASQEPLLVSYLHSTILNHATLRSALSFHMANRLASPNMIATQVMAIFLDAFTENPDICNAVRRDLLAVRQRDPACTCLPDAFLYFKGFHALVAHRVANHLWKGGRLVLAHYLQSQTSQVFQIDIHPNATLGSGIMLDHGTGIVIGSTARIGDNCSILHHVTLGGSGKKDVDRHPKVGSGVLIGAGSSILGNVVIGNSVQVGAGSLVIDDVPDSTVVVGVPARVIGRVAKSEEETGRESPAERMSQNLAPEEGGGGFEFDVNFDV
jgi:serine O-acetyltransferase